MLWWRYNKKEKAFRKAKTWQKENEANRECGNTTRAFLSVLKLDEE